MTKQQIKNKHVQNQSNDGKWSQIATPWQLDDGDTERHFSNCRQGQRHHWLKYEATMPAAATDTGSKNKKNTTKKQNKNENPQFPTAAVTTA